MRYVARLLEREILASARRFPALIVTGPRSVASIRDLATFRRFLSLVASRCGQILNRTDLAAPLGISVPTVSEWIGILEITGTVLLVPPFHENFGKRLI